MKNLFTLKQLAKQLENEVAGKAKKEPKIKKPKAEPEDSIYSAMAEWADAIAKAKGESK